MFTTFIDSSTYDKYADDKDNFLEPNPEMSRKVVIPIINSKMFLFSYFKEKMKGIIKTISYKGFFLK
jgi:hypothetical protein